MRHIPNATEHRTRGLKPDDLVLLVAEYVRTAGPYTRWTDDTTPRTDNPVRFLCPTCGLPQHKGPRDESGRRLSGCAIRHTA